MQRLFTLPILIFLLTACGSGGGDSPPLSLVDTAGGWTGSVELFENGCPREIPQEARTLYFTHSIELQSSLPGFSNVILNDGVGPCLAERVENLSNTFLAVCPERELVDFLTDYECAEELVWQYTIEDAAGTAPINPVVRTAHVRCRQNGIEALACPVEYRGSIGRCVKGLC